MKKVFLISAFLMLMHALTNQSYAQCAISIGSDMVLCNTGQVVLPQPTSSQIINRDIWTTSGTGRFYPDSLQSPSYYIPSSDDVANGSVNLSCIANLNCGTAQATIKVTFTGTTPSILWNGYYPSSVTSCGQAPVTATPYVSNAASVQWTTKGGGSFDNPANVSVVYTPSSADVINGTVILYIKAIGTGQCSVVDSFTINLITSSIASLGNNTAVCLQNAGSAAQVHINITDTAHVSFGGGAGSFYPNFQNKVLFYLPTAAEINAGSVTLTASTPATSSCGAGSSQVTLTLLSAPIVSAGSNQLVCNSGGTYSQVTLNGSASVSNGNPSMTYYWKTNGTGTFSSPNSISTIYTPSNADFGDTAVTITLNASYGSISCLNNNSILVTFKSPLTLNQIPTIITGCAGSVLPIDSSISYFGTWSTTGKGSILMNSMNYVNGYQSLTTDSIVWMKFTSFNDGICPQDTVSVKLVMEPIVVNIVSNQNTVGNTVTTCSDSVQLSGLTGSRNVLSWSTNGTGIFSPSTTETNTFYHFSNQDKTVGSIKIFVSASNSTCTPAFDTITVAILPPAQTIYAGADQVVPSGNINLAGTHTGAGYVRWTTNGTGIFINNSDTLVNAVYQPSANDYNVGILTFVLTGFDTTTVCGNLSSKMMVKIGTGYTINGQVLIGGSVVPPSINIDVYSYANNSMEYVKTYTGPSAYTIVNIPSGTYILKFYLSDTSSLCGNGPTCQYLPTYLGDSTEWQNAYPLVITNADVNTMNTYLTLAYPISSSRIGGDSLYGVVTTATPPSSRIVSGQAGSNLVEGASVSLIDTSGHIIYTTQTNASGEFLFKHIVQGNYTLIIDYPGVKFTPVNVSVKGASNTFNPVPLQLTTGVVVGLSKESVNIYPNPANAALHVDLLNDLSANTVINIIDQSGRLLSTYSVSNKSTLLNIDSLSSGLYLIQITDGTTIVSSKFIKL